MELFMQNQHTVRERLSKNRNLPKIPINLPSGLALEFGTGEHNQLQKAIIEEFLPRYGFGASVIYVSGVENKFRHDAQAMADSLGLLRLSYEELPDVIAFSREKNWLYLIDAVHSNLRRVFSSESV